MQWYPAKNRIFFQLQNKFGFFLILSCIISCSSPAFGRDSFFSVSGNTIVDTQGSELILQGIQLDFGSARGDADLLVKDPDSFNNSMLDYIIVESDFALLKSMGVNTIRLSLNTYKDFEDDNNPYTYFEGNFAKLDRVISWADKYNLFLIISMRQSPGGHNSSAHSGNEGKNELWLNAVYQDRLAGLWKKIAQRYTDRNIVIGYDLINEPEADNAGQLNAVYNQIILKIREIDTNHIIFLEGNSFGRYLDGLDLNLDSNCALSIHFYAPGVYAVDGKGTYPTVIGGQDFNRDALEATVLERINYAVVHNKPVWVGEFGAMSSAGNYLHYDQDLVSIFKENNLSWNYWHFKNLKGSTTTQALYYMDFENVFLKLLHGQSVNENEALEALTTDNFIQRTELKTFLENNY